MAFTLGAHIHACIDADVPIFLDLAADRYFRLKPDAEAAFRRLATNEAPQAEDPARLAELVTMGILRDIGMRPSETFDLLTPPPPLDDELSGDARPPLHILAGIVFSRLRIRLAQQRAMRLLLDLDVARNAGPPPARQDEAGRKLAAEMVGGLAHSDMIMAPAGRCLERALALVGHLRRVGERADLVLGITARPFSAHCWVQQGPLLLGDRIERVSTFTPIAVL
ncbi:lasso peptide biosynthesis B2 protein [Telmatospirillum sp.]|uniref:lasso peptide biosynthesis B2 protein n=1 Tax=Telmatospirillum sp. TaxID=2079197 RepID=UPI002852340A|nr:lasso peptide biosynthesis B2 protein [Telmatospirillum sp.]MDR3438114.1 lasso peptide biosynthesis B2 protein [Telmatospirillum sp.]